MVTTPGVYFEALDRNRSAIGPLRTDIAGLVGYAGRGPLLVPVRVTSWRQFTATFGPPPAEGYLAYAVRGFFDNGGAACHVVRVADPDIARAASVTLAGEDGAATLRLWASYGELHDPASDAPVVAGEHPARYENPGVWANALSVSVQPAGLGATRTQGSQPPGGASTFVAGLSGFEIGSVVRLSQDGAGAPAFRLVVDRDPHRRRLTWDRPLAGLGGLDLGHDFDLETVEFSLLFHLDGQIVERHLGLSLSPQHSRYVVNVLRAASSLLDAAVLVNWDTGEWSDPGRWPQAAARVPLSGGDDGLAAMAKTTLRTVGKDSFVAALDALAQVDEVSLLAAPDLVLRPGTPVPKPRPVSVTDPCRVLEAPPKGRLVGQVLEHRAGGHVPLALVDVRVLERAAATLKTDAFGKFELQSLPVGRVTLLLERAGYHSLEVTAQSYIVPPAELARFYLVPIALPPAFSLDDILDVQQAMLRQGEQGLYRVALLDPPPEMLDIEAIQTWRARFDSAYAALYYPWLMVQPEGGGDVIQVPPSGHVAGLIARTDLHEGVHRAPANYPLDGVKALTELVDDAQQGLLNPLHVNCVRLLPGRGICVYGARTLSSDPEWRYLNVRRVVLMIEEAIEDSSQWAVFEPNRHVLRQALAFNLSSFLNALWRQGMLAGDTPEAAYRVKCDDDNNLGGVVDAGQIIAEIDVAPAVPFEFIHFRLGRTVEAIEVTE